MGIRSFIHRLTAPPIKEHVPAGNYKLAIVVNNALKMKKGKIAAQVGHGAVSATLASSPALLDAWFSSGQAKICLKGDSDEHLLQLKKKAEQSGLPAVKIRDAGRTQIPAGSLTIVAIGPSLKEDLETITGDLKLL
tara:strand:- start:127 stop:534 length:408 start_codon:yes stop_codon:yes gene_type:complete